MNDSSRESDGEPREQGAASLREAVERGDLVACHRLARRYLTGDGVDQDLLQAVALFQRAATAGYAPSQTSLGVCYLVGQGVDRDPALALTWLRRAADQANASAQYNIGRCHERGLGVAQDSVQAVEWYRRAAEQGATHPQVATNAQIAIADAYRFGRGVAKDVPEAVRWYRRAAVARPKLQSVIRHCRVSQIPVVRHYHRITWYAGLALLAYHTATVPFSFRWQAALLFVGVISGTALVGSVVVPWLWPARWKATAEEFGFALLAWPPKYVLGFVLQIASEDGFFLVPLLHVGISVPLAIVTGAGFGCAHYGQYGLPMSAVKGAAYVLVALFVLPSGIWSVIAGHLIVDVIAFGFDRRGSIKDMCSKFPP